MKTHVLVLVIALVCTPGKAAEPALFARGRLTVGGGTKAWLPNVAKLHDGTILCAYVEGNAPLLDSIWAVVTRDAGKSWSKPVKVMRLPAKGYIADPNILVVGKRATIFATFVPDTKPAFACSETWAAASEDSGRTWGKPVQIPIAHKYVSGKVHVRVTLKDGTLAMGYSWDTKAEAGRPAGAEVQMVTKAGILRSRDAGRTWKPGGDISVNEPMGADEPALVVLQNGDLFAIVRTCGPRPYEVRSEDGGLTWEKPKPSRFEGHNSPSALLGLKNGAILRVWDNSAKNRYPLVASISTDECQTWSPPKTITKPANEKDGKLSFTTACYPSMAQADDGAIVLVWWETGNFGSRIGLACFGHG